MGEYIVSAYFRKHISIIHEELLPKKAVKPTKNKRGATDFNGYFTKE